METNTLVKWPIKAGVSMSRVPTLHTIALIEVARTLAKGDSALPMSNAGARRTANTRQLQEPGDQDRS